MKTLGVLLLAFCRTVYCWIFFVLSALEMYVVCTNIRTLMLTHSITRGDILSNVSFATYSIVSGAAWWMILRGKPALKKWAIAASLVLVFVFPALVNGNWRWVLKAELSVWPIILTGIFGTVVFSIPYRGWRNKSPIQAN